jgi:hypothetical protein
MTSRLHPTGEKKAAEYELRIPSILSGAKSLN